MKFKDHVSLLETFTLLLHYSSFNYTPKMSDIRRLFKSISFEFFIKYANAFLFFKIVFYSCFTFLFSKFSVIYSIVPLFFSFVSFWQPWILFFRFYYFLNDVFIGSDWYVTITFWSSLATLQPSDHIVIVTSSKIINKREKWLICE